jgi:hypothetical protein
MIGQQLNHNGVGVGLDRIEGMRSGQLVAPLCQLLTNATKVHNEEASFGFLGAFAQNSLIVVIAREDVNIDTQKVVGIVVVQHFHRQIGRETEIITDGLRQKGTVIPEVGSASTSVQSLESRTGVDIRANIR